MSACSSMCQTACPVSLFNVLVCMVFLPLYDKEISYKIYKFLLTTNDQVQLNFNMLLFILLNLIFY